jgi:hypothetical protein
LYRQHRFIARQEWLRTVLNFECVLVYDGQFGWFFTRDGGFIAHERRFDFRRADSNDVTTCLARWKNEFSRRFRFL